MSEETKVFIEPRDSSQFPWAVKIQYRGTIWTVGVFSTLAFARFKRWRVNRAKKHIGRPA